jgi:hypothetical protein
MSGLFGEKVSLGQANGPDVELIVSGDEWYATYQTTAGYSAIYDDQRGLFCYAALSDGRFVSTGVPVTEPAPANAAFQETESAEVQAAKIAERESRIRQQSSFKSNEE